jgi:hypothetical protein
MRMAAYSISSGPCQDRLWRPIITDLDDSLAETLERHREATTAVRNGDATPLIEMLSTRDPLTLFPAAQPSKTGMAEVSQAFRRVASGYTESAPLPSRSWPQVSVKAWRTSSVTRVRRPQSGAAQSIP